MLLATNRSTLLNTPITKSYLLNTPAVLLAPARHLCPLAFGSGDLWSGHRRAKQRRSAQPVYMANFLSRLFGGGNSTNENVEV